MATATEPEEIEVDDVSDESDTHIEYGIATYQRAREVVHCLNATMVR